LFGLSSGLFWDGLGGAEPPVFPAGTRRRRRTAPAQGDIDVLEELAGSDAQDTVGGFDEVIALHAAVLSAKNVGEGEAGGELFGFDQKASAISGP